MKILKGKFKVGDKLSVVKLPPIFINKREEKCLMKQVLKQAAVILGNSENLMTDVMEFYAEVTKVLVAKRRKNEALQEKMTKKLMRHASPLLSSDFAVKD